MDTTLVRQLLREKGVGVLAGWTVELTFPAGLKLSPDEANRLGNLLIEASLEARVMREEVDVLADMGLSAAQIHDFLTRMADRTIRPEATTPAGS